MKDDPCAGEGGSGGIRSREGGSPEAATQPLAARVVEAARQIAVHYGLWLAETAHQLGPERAVELESQVGDAYIPLLTRRIERALGLSGDVNSVLESLGEEKLGKLLDALAVSWLAADGVWFRKVEDARGMHDAKRVNDTCWSRLGYYEALRAKAALGLPERGGLPALKAAFGARLVSRINQWEIAAETPDSFVLRMVRCRVQSSRERQGLPPYPCISGGSVEYTAFAAGIDPAIVTTCVSCPPDITLPDCACAWKFSVR